MNTDRDLLELAAKAAGIEIHFDDEGDCYRITSSGIRTYWDPRHFDGDAFRLMVDLRLIVVQYTAGLTVHQGGPVLSNTSYAKFDGNRCASTRHALVSAAAEIGRKMQEGGAA